MGGAQENKGWSPGNQWLGVLETNGWGPGNQWLVPRKPNHRAQEINC